MSQKRKKYSSLLQNVHELEYREESRKQLLKHENPLYSQGMIRGKKTLCCHGGKEWRKSTIPWSKREFNEEEMINSQEYCWKILKIIKKGHWVGDYMSKFYDPWRVITLIFETTRSILNNWSHVVRPKQTNKQNTHYFSLSMLKNKCEFKNRQETVPVWGNN